MVYGICMEEHTCEARLPHVNGNVARNRKYLGAKRTRSLHRRQGTDTRP